MKYLSTILFALCLGWTWKVIHTQGSVPFNTHAALQSKLAEIIANTIQTMKPDSENFKMEYLWTEALPNGQIKAHFSYKFEEVDAEQDIVENGLEGYAILEKEKSIADTDDKWTVVDVKTNSDTLNFREGLVITPGKAQDLTDPTPTQLPQSVAPESAPPPTSQAHEVNTPTQDATTKSEQGTSGNSQSPIRDNQPQPSNTPTATGN
jgi:hypothetical protein